MRRVVPNALTPLVVLATLGVATAILEAAGLSVLGLGAQRPRRVELPGLELSGVEQALPWLAAVNSGIRSLSDHGGIYCGSGRAVQIPPDPRYIGPTMRLESGQIWPRSPTPSLRSPVTQQAPSENLAGKTVLVLGGGDTAMDCARSARRLGARVRVVYRGPEGCLRAAAKEVALAREEKVEFLFDHAPEAFLGADRLESVRFAGGAVLSADQAVLAFGQQPDPPPWLAGLGVGLEPDGRIRVDGRGRTGHPRIYAGGDNTHGPGLAVTAMAAGRRAAEGVLANTARRLPFAGRALAGRAIPAEQALDYLGSVDTACPAKVPAGRPVRETG